jgi:hypothetical protein
MSETQWKQFVQLFAEKNQHLSKQQVLQMAKKPFQQLQKYFSQRGGAKRHFKIHSITGKEIEVDVDTKLRVIDLKRLIAAESGIETDSQKLIHWKGGPDSFRQGEYMVLDNSEKLSTIPFDKDVETDLDLLSEPMCQIVSIEDDAKYPGKYEMKDPPCRLWTFILENGEEFKVYRTNRPKGSKNRYINYLVPRKGDDITSKGHAYDNIYDILAFPASSFGATAKDGYVIELTLKTHETEENQALGVGEPLVLVKHEIPGSYLTHLPVFCECGVIVDLDKMKAHLKTKKHEKGGEEGKQFMERARAYVSEWTA